MVVSVDEIASRAGVEVMKKGGNAVDATVAVALTLAVTWPSAGNLGGGGFMMIRLPDGTSEVIDYRERAPLAATRDMFLDQEGGVIAGASTLGYRAIGVPGTVAGLALAHQRHGKLRWSELVEPARKLAVEGFPVSFMLARSLNHHNNAGRLAKFPESKRIFGRKWEMGDTLVQPDLGATLKRIRDGGAGEFYRGRTAKMIVADVRANGGILSAEDFEQYTPAIRQPLRGTYRGYEILTMPPPSSGGAVLLEMLNMLSRFDVASLGHNSADGLNLLFEVERRAYADRAAYMGDTDFVEVPIGELISDSYAARRAAEIRLGKATPSSEVAAGLERSEPAETTHFNVIDRSGTVVSNTYTLNDSYGSAVTAKGTGILLNNEMDDFTSKPGVPNLYGLVQSSANAIEPKKRPLSAMTPTLVLHEGRLFMALGSPGGGSIINSVLQVILNVVDHGMSIQEAVDAPRLHHQWLPDLVFWEKGGLNSDTRAHLEKRGFEFHEKSGYPAGDLTVGDAHALMVDRTNGFILGAADPRRGGCAVGY
jgi:gamma-glutamyltranspeptidase/glutathione hydrolase